MYYLQYFLTAEIYPIDFLQVKMSKILCPINTYKETYILKFLKFFLKIVYRIFYMCGFDIFHYATIKRIGRKFSRYCCRFPGCVPAIRLCRSIPGRRRRAWRLVSGSACASLTCQHMTSFPLPTYPRIVGPMY